MRYRLRDDLYYCEVDQRVIFLDIQKDRYFRLSKTLEQAFKEFAAEPGHPGTSIDALIQRKILTDAPRVGSQTSYATVERPRRSAVERSLTDDPLDFPAIRDVFSAVGSTWLQMKTRSLKDILVGLDVYRRRRAPLSRHQTAEQRKELIRAVDGFRRGRHYVPIEPLCLLDSLAMLKFLAKRRLHANLVFGITGEPFSAHCWLQVGDLVLNDTVGNVNAHTPMRAL